MNSGNVLFKVVGGLDANKDINDNRYSIVENSLLIEYNGKNFYCITNNKAINLESELNKKILELVKNNFENEIFNNSIYDYQFKINILSRTRYFVIDRLNKNILIQDVKSGEICKNVTRSLLNIRKVQITNSFCTKQNYL